MGTLHEGTCKDYSASCIAFQKMTNAKPESEKIVVNIQAERLLKRCLEILQRHCGSGNNISIATTQTKLGGVCIAQNKPSNAEIYLRAALFSIEQGLGPEHPDTALAQCRLASCMADMKWWVELTIESLFSCISSALAKDPKLCYEAIIAGCQQSHVSLVQRS